MQLNNEDIVTILKLFDESNFDSLQLECGDIRLVVAMNGSTPDQERALVSIKPAKAAEEKANEAVEIDEGLAAIKAPMVGTFYSRPEPGAEPFVGVGSEVNGDSTVGIIEVMKVFSSVASGVKGVITKILVEDSQFVEYGQPLFLVRPDDSIQGGAA